MCCRRSCFRGKNLFWSSKNSVVLRASGVLRDRERLQCPAPALKWALSIGMGHDWVLLEALISTTAGSFLGLEVLVVCRAC